MPLGYKYVERDADSQINWAEVGKSLSDVLLETKRVREEKKDAIDQSIRQSLNTLANAPQGANQDVNKFMNNYTSDMSAQILLDKKLLQSGQMDPKHWTLRQQNYTDGTNQMLNLSKTYQEKSKEIMDGIDSGQIQSSLGLYNMGTIEGFKDFNNSRATIDSNGDGKVSLALYENKIIDGKEVRVLSKNNMPVNVLLGQILNQPKKFDVEGNTAATAKAFGSRFQAVYKAASTVGSGTITELLGVEAMKKYPQFKPIVDEMNTAINDQVESYFAGNPLNLVSVLGENTGNYNSSSFTYDKEEAAKDHKKILLKIDPRTQTATMDENAPHYKEQKKEAIEWTKRSLMSKLDSEAKVSTVGQLSETEAQKLRAQSKFPKPRAGGEDDTKPVGVGEINIISSTDKSGKKTTTGVSQRLENMIIDEGEGVQNVATDIGYNNKTGALEVKGYQISGKSQQGKKTVVGEGEVTGTSGSTFVKKEKFLTNDVNNASLLSIIVTKIPNPENPGYNFSNINEAKNYYKRQYQSQTGKKEKKKIGGF